MGVEVSELFDAQRILVRSRILRARIDLNYPKDLAYGGHILFRSQVSPGDVNQSDYTVVFMTKKEYLMLARVYYRYSSDLLKLAPAHVPPRIHESRQENLDFILRPPQSLSSRQEVTYAAQQGAKTAFSSRYAPGDHLGQEINTGEYDPARPGEEKAAPFIYAPAHLQRFKIYKQRFSNMSRKMWQGHSAALQERPVYRPDHDIDLILPLGIPAVDRKVQYHRSVFIKPQPRKGLFDEMFDKILGAKHLPRPMNDIYLGFYAQAPRPGDLISSSSAHMSILPVDSAQKMPGVSRRYSYLDRTVMKTSRRPDFPALVQLTAIGDVDKKQLSWKQCLLVNTRLHIYGLKKTRYNTLDGKGSFVGVISPFLPGTERPDFHPVIVSTPKQTYAQYRDIMVHDDIPAARDEISGSHAAYFLKSNRKKIFVSRNRENVSELPAALRKDKWGTDFSHLATSGRKSLFQFFPDQLIFSRRQVLYGKHALRLHDAACRTQTGALTVLPLMNYRQDEEGVLTVLPLMNYRQDEEGVLIWDSIFGIDRHRQSELLRHLYNISGRRRLKYPSWSPVQLGTAELDYEVPITSVDENAFYPLQAVTRYLEHQIKYDLLWNARRRDKDSIYEFIWDEPGKPMYLPFAEKGIGRESRWVKIGDSLRGREGPLLIWDLDTSLRDLNAYSHEDGLYGSWRGIDASYLAGHLDFSHRGNEIPFLLPFFVAAKHRWRYASVLSDDAASMRRIVGPARRVIFRTLKRGDPPFYFFRDLFGAGRTIKPAYGISPVKGLQRELGRVRSVFTSFAQTVPADAGQNTYMPFDLPGIRISTFERPFTAVSFVMQRHLYSLGKIEFSTEDKIRSAALAAIITWRHHHPLRELSLAQLVDPLHLAEERGSIFVPSIKAADEIISSRQTQTLDEGGGDRADISRGAHPPLALIAPEYTSGMDRPIWKEELVSIPPDTLWEDIWNLYTEGYDPLHLPGEDFPYDPEALYNTETGEVYAPLSAPDAADVYLEKPPRHPWPQWADWGSEELEVELSVLVGIMLIGRAFWVTYIEEIDRMNAYQTLTAVLQYIAQSVRLYDKGTVYRAFRHARWYAEAVALKRSDFLLKRHLDSVAIVPPITIPYDNDGFMISSFGYVRAESDAAITFHVNAVISTLLTCSVEIKDAQARILIDDLLMGTFAASQAGISIPVPMGTKKITFQAVDVEPSGFVEFSGIIIEKLEFAGAEFEFKSDELDGQEAIHEWLMMLTKYFVDHHEQKQKGTRKFLT